MAKFIEMEAEATVETIAKMNEESEDKKDDGKN